jgi:hypothetical protein
MLIVKSLEPPRAQIRRQPSSVIDMRTRAVLREQPLDRAKRLLTIERGHVEGRPAVIVASVRVSAVTQQQLDGGFTIAVALSRTEQREHQRRATSVIASVNRRTSLDQRVDAAQPIVVSRPVQRRPAIVVTQRRIGPMG